MKWNLLAETIMKARTLASTPQDLEESQRKCGLFHRTHVQDRFLGRGGHEVLIACRYRYRILQPGAQADT